VLPYHRRLVETFWDGEGRLSIHLCGDASRHFPILKEELGVTVFDTGFPIDLHEMRRQLGADVILQGGPTVELLRCGPVDEIRRVTRELLEGPAARDGLFVLREANNLAPCTPPEHVAAMYDTAREYGRY
jgi:uroporphyrinogen-III decarboxylase